MAMSQATKEGIEYNNYIDEKEPLYGFLRF